MQVHYGIHALTPEWPSAVACIGTFDGFHRGHQGVLATAVTLARARALPAVVLTFDRHPAATLAPDRVPPALAEPDLVYRYMHEHGADLVIVLPFDHAMSQMSAEDFLRDIVVAKARAEALVIGADFALGRGRAGDAAWLRARIETHVAPQIEEAGSRISSSEIRRRIAAGETEQAARMLGRPYALSGLVVGGEQLGRRLGYPTLNLALARRMAVPADGVYAGEARTPVGRFRAAISIGTRPTVAAGDARSIEAYLLNYPGDSLYGRPVFIAFGGRLRGQVKFATVEELQAQMARDVAQIERGNQP